MLARWNATGLVLAACMAGPLAGHATENFELRSTIAFSSNRDNLTIFNPLDVEGAEVYLMNADFTDVRRLTGNTAADLFAALSPDGKRIVFDSWRDRAAGEPRNTSDLYVMNTDGTEQMHLLRGSSATWSADSKNIAYHASASGTGLPIRPDGGAPATDSDIFVLNVDDWLAGADTPRNITNSPEMIEDDADWSPDGQTILFTSHPVTDNPNNAVHQEIYRINPDGTGLVRLTDNLEEERAPSWSADGTRILFMCRRGGPDFELCTVDANGSNPLQPTDNATPDLTATFSPDGQKIVFQRPIGFTSLQLWLMNSDGTNEVQMTSPPSSSLFANWGELRVHVAGSQTAGDAAKTARLSLRLDPVGPNPFRVEATFRLVVPASGPVRLAVYDVLGRRVATLLEESLAAGPRSASWNGLDRLGRPVPSGTYFAKLEAGGQTQVRKVVVAH